MVGTKAKQRIISVLQTTFMIIMSALQFLALVLQYVSQLIFILTVVHIIGFCKYYDRCNVWAAMDT